MRNHEIWQVLGISWRLWGWLWSPGSEVIRSGGGSWTCLDPYSQTSNRWNGGYHDIKQMEWRTLRHQDQDSCDILIHLNLIEAGLYMMPHSLVAPKGPADPEISRDIPGYPGISRDIFHWTSFTGSTATRSASP